MSFSVGNQIDVVMLNTAGVEFFSGVETLRPRVTWQHGGAASTEFDLGIRWQSFAEPSDSSLDRTGPGVRPRVIHRRRMGPLLASLGFVFDAQFAQGEEYQSTSVQVPFSLTVPRLWRSLGFIASLEAALTQYPQSSSDRSDVLLQGGLGFRLPWLSRSLWGLDWGVRSNASNLDAATYLKQTVTLSYTHDLF
jgi:hypothetical protein